MINGTSRLLLRKETSLLMRNLEVGVETQMKNVIISSRMWLGLALAVILGAITQTLPSSLACESALYDQMIVLKHSYKELAA